MEDRIKILGFAGSLRKGSYNKALLRAATEIIAGEADLETFELNEIPPFNQDEENRPPASVQAFKSKIKAADALLIATPEYNYSMPGVLKNAIDWASRPFPAENVLEGKPLAIMGASVGMIGTARAQYHLRQSCVFVNMHPLNRPEVMVAYAQDKIDTSGKLTDETSREKIKELLQSLVAWTRKLRQLQYAMT